MKNLLFFINHIENSISKTLIYYAIIVTFTISAFLIGMTANIMGHRGEVSINDNKMSSDNYFENNTSEDVAGINTDENKYTNMSSSKTVEKSVIFGSVKGKYFYYKGCGGDSIAAKNLRYYKSEAEAIKLGKKLYKGCE